MVQLILISFVSIPTKTTPSVTTSTSSITSNPMSLSLLSFKPKLRIDTFLPSSAYPSYEKEQPIRTREVVFCSIRQSLLLTRRKPRWSLDETMEFQIFKQLGKLLSLTTSSCSYELQKLQDQEGRQKEELCICESSSPQLVSQTLPDISQPMPLKGAEKLCLEGTVFSQGLMLTVIICGWMAVWSTCCREILMSRKRNEIAIILLCNRENHQEEGNKGKQRHIGAII